MFKDVRLPDLARFIEYHLLLGVDHLLLVDNNCGAKADQAAAFLKPYINAKLVTHNTAFCCVQMKGMNFINGYRGGSALSRQLTGMLLQERVPVKKGALVVSIDDDEYIGIKDPTKTLQDVALTMKHETVCAVMLRWRVYGSSFHECQPSGPLIKSFTRRGWMYHELNKTRQREEEEEAGIAILNTPFGAKPMFLYQSHTLPHCGTHWCDRCERREEKNCAEEKFYKSPNPSCTDDLPAILTESDVWLNHYSFQSAEHWENKKKRGRTNILPKRKGGVPAFYDQVVDTEALELLEIRIRAIHQTGLRSCLADLFQLPGASTYTAAIGLEPRIKASAAPHVIRRAASDRGPRRRIGKKGLGKSAGHRRDIGGSVMDAL